MAHMTDNELSKLACGVVFDIDKEVFKGKLEYKKFSAILHILLPILKGLHYQNKLYELKEVSVK